MARNIYPGFCYSCSTYIPPGYGHFELRKGQTPKWRLKCVKCASGRTVTEDDPCVKAVEQKLRQMGGDKE